MDTSYTYGTPNGTRAALYAPPNIEVPDTIDMTVDGKSVTFHRLSDASMVCDAVPGVKGVCGSADCHRRVLGECQCKRHGRVVFTRAVRPAAR
jgi:hypothetical protein